MLGRLRMSLTDCKEAYMTLSRQAFTPKNIITRTVQLPGLSPKFKIKLIANAVKDIIGSAHERLGAGPEEALLKEDDAACKVFVLDNNLFQQSY
jgi:hypothetical protein